MKTQQADFVINDYGTIFLFMPLSDAARRWLRQHCPKDEEHQYLGRSLVVGHRFICDLVDHAVADGLWPVSRH